MNLNDVVVLETRERRMMGDVDLFPDSTLEVVELPNGETMEVMRYSVRSGGYGILLTRDKNEWRDHGENRMGNKLGRHHYCMIGVIAGTICKRTVAIDSIAA